MIRVKRLKKNPELFILLPLAGLCMLMAALIFFPQLLDNLEGRLGVLFLVVGVFAALLAVFLSVSRLGRELRRAPENGALRLSEQCLYAETLNQLFASVEASRQHLHESAKIKDIQLKMLMNQINPHFLYNTLESIRGQALCSDDLVVANMAETLSIFFRYCISQKGSIVRLEEEIKNVNIFIRIMEFRMPNKFEFSVIADATQCMEYQIPKLTLQPIIENTILHGISDYKSGGKISVRVLETESTLKIYIRDNGIGIPAHTLREMNQKLSSGYEQPVATGGIALYNINHRIKLAFGNQYGLRIYSTEGVGTNVGVYLPKMKMGKQV